MRQAAFIGVGAVVGAGAGIFALLGAVCHFRVQVETGANAAIPAVAIAAAAVVRVTSVLTTLTYEPS